MIRSQQSPVPQRHLVLLAGGGNLVDPFAASERPLGPAASCGRGGPALPFSVEVSGTGLALSAAPGSTFQFDGQAGRRSLLVEGPGFFRVGGLPVAVCEAGPDGSLLLGDMIGSARSMADVFFRAMAAASSDRPVLVGGPSGSGKELVASAIHNFGARRKGPFVALNCGEFSHELAGSELFGCCRGAYTGAVRDREGLINRANGGSLFLDEIADLPLETQAAMLRVLEGAPVRPVGGLEWRQVDFRLLAATNASLCERVSCGTFRSDLYHRLSILQVRLPPLRERGTDILLLWRQFSGQDPRFVLAPDTRDLLLAYPWPGNVRELKALVERLRVFAGPEITRKDLREALLEHSVQDSGSLSGFLKVAGVPRSTYYYRMKRRDEADGRMGVREAPAEPQAEPEKPS